MRQKSFSYKASGVSYDVLDTFKRLAQKHAARTSRRTKQVSEVRASRGESAYVWEEKDSYRAFVIEGLGTKNLVADAMNTVTPKTYYDTIAYDTVAMIINDLIVVGAQPQVVNAYFAVGNSHWFANKKRVNDLVKGWADACVASGAIWGGGETPTLTGIVSPETIDLAGSATGIIAPKNRLVLGDSLQAGDAIVLVESSGIHANGLTLARAIAKKLSKGYRTKLDNGMLFGEALLTPTHIYASLVRDVFASGIDIHYMVNITGHGWRKLMRAERAFSYVMHAVPEPHTVFGFMQKQSGIDDKEMYGTFNMGAGFAFFVPPGDVKRVMKLATDHGFKSLFAGVVEKGRKQVIIKPKQITYAGNSLQVRA